MSSLKFMKLSPEAKIPTKGTKYSAGYDLYTDTVYTVAEDHPTTISFGVAVEIPEGYVGLLVERSSTAKKGFFLENSVGIIDSDYRGELKAFVGYMEMPNDDRDIDGESNFTLIKQHECLFQLVVVPAFTLPVEEVTELSVTERGDGGFGSTDQKDVA